jgi:tRNA(Ile)-lysidine synthase
MDVFRENLKILKLKTNDRLILGVSGGIDSVVMLDLFSKAGFSNAVVAHLNHGVRKEADKDQSFVEKLAKKYDFVFETKTIIPPSSGNLEEQLRNERKIFLYESAKKHKAKFIALAHNKNDQAETVILNLLRGAGPAGLAGMTMKENSVVRPLLNVKRRQIFAYAKENKLDWMEDVTNFDLSFNRNFIRHQIFPLFEQVNSDYLENIYRSANIIEEIDEKLKNEAKKYLGSNVFELQKLEKPVLFEVFAIKYERVKGDRKNLSFANFADLQKLISKPEGTKTIDLPAGILARRAYETLEFLPKKEDNIYSIDVEVKLKIGKNKFGNWLFTASKTEKYIPDPKKMTFFVDENLFGQLTIRKAGTGAKIKKEGVLGSSKLQDLFIDAKIARDERKNWPVVTIGQEIIWIPTIAFGQNGKPKTNHLIKISARKEVNEK